MSEPANGMAQATLEEILRLAWDRGRSAAAKDDLFSQGQALAYYDILDNGISYWDIYNLRPFTDRVLESANPDDIINPPKEALVIGTFADSSHTERTVMTDETDEHLTPAQVEGMAKVTLEEILRMALDYGRELLGSPEPFDEGRVLAYYIILSSGKARAASNGLTPFDDPVLEKADPDELINPLKRRPLGT